ncbi:cytochrome P450 [Sphingobium tyrosinilyticum]|uniref:Cytochrome P450 n=1 Tax=Sphingobium tyrosinilyticum TaxID=2715436 RepID=A0ABV9F1I6_9SPHN
MNALSPVSPRPDHVPEEAVYDFDMYLDPALLTDPHERVRELLRDAPPVFWTPRNGGHWVVTGYAENYAASRDTESFSSQLMPTEQAIAIMEQLPPGVHHPSPTPITMDPPVHTMFRQPLNPYFSPKAMLARKQEIRSLANELIDQFIDKGHCDFIPEFAETLPVQVFLNLLGLPGERQAEFRDLVHMFLAPITSLEDSTGRMRKVADAMADVVKARQHDPKDDLISLLWQTKIDGKDTTYELMEDFGVLLFIAGLDTVINGIGYGIRHLARNPDLQAQLRENPKQIVEAAEEILRRYTFTIPQRRIAKDVELGGWQMKENDRLSLYLPGADLDEREFASPENFDLNRENKVHIAFGVGPHRCLGSHLARIELQVAYEVMLERLPQFRLDPEKPAKFHAGFILAMDSLPLRWD